jgi:hypothetical protein
MLLKKLLQELINLKPQAMKIEPYIYPEGEWMQKRAGSFTSSQIYKLYTSPKTKLAKDNGELSETAKTYIMEKAAELMTGTIRNSYTTPEMQWGIDNEAAAIEAIKDKYPDVIHYGGENPMFINYSDFSGGSPDGVDLNKVFEIKCPNPVQHIENLMYKNLKDLNMMYWHQLQMNMACVAKLYGYNVMDMIGIFISYCPLMIEKRLQVHEIKVMPDAEFQTNLPSVINKAEDELRKIINSFEL